MAAVATATAAALCRRSSRPISRPPAAVASLITRRLSPCSSSSTATISKARPSEDGRPSALRSRSISSLGRSSDGTGGKGGTTTGVGGGGGGGGSNGANGTSNSSSSSSSRNEAASPTTPPWGRPADGGGGNKGGGGGGVRVYYRNRGQRPKKKKPSVSSSSETPATKGGAATTTTDRGGDSKRDDDAAAAALRRPQGRRRQGRDRDRDDDDDDSAHLHVLRNGYSNSYSSANANNRFGGRGGRFHLPPSASHPLPILNFSPYLDPKTYCRQSARPGGTTTISGGDAARRLVRGRARVGEVVRDELVNRDLGGGGGGISDPYRWASSGSSSGGGGGGGGGGSNDLVRRGAFALTGHGVPVQLLRDHVDLADSLLRRMNNAAELSFGNCLDGRLEFDWMRVRSREGRNEPVRWPVVGDDDGAAGGKVRGSGGNDDDDHGGDFGLPPFGASFLKHPKNEQEVELWLDYEHRLNVYLAAMRRVVDAFGTVLGPSEFDGLPTRRRRRRPATTVIDPDNIGSDAGEEEGGSGGGDDGGRYELRHWNAGFLRGNAYPPQIVPNDGAAGGGGRSGTSVITTTSAAAVLSLPPRDGALAGKRRSGTGTGSASGSGSGGSSSVISPPIIELSQGDAGSGSPAYVRISVQGMPSHLPPSETATATATAPGTTSRRRRRRATPVTVVFDAKFGRREE